MISGLVVGSDLPIANSGLSCGPTHEDKMKKIMIATALASAMTITHAHHAHAGPDEYIGEIITVGFNFCPRGTLLADGRLLAISENTALFSLFGTIYGGDGRSTFALPDLRGRTIIGSGQGPGLSSRSVGQRGGVENQTTSVSVTTGDQTETVGASKGDNMQPFLTMTNCVVTQGIFPSRN